MQGKIRINKVAVLGSGVMGAQIAAHFANALIPVVLFDLKSDKGSANAILETSINNLKKLKPNPASASYTLPSIKIANYDDDMAMLEDCDLIIEAIAERMDWKIGLYERIEKSLKKNVILATNSSGLSIKELAAGISEDLRANFCGIHFFNPPRYMPLVELIPHDATDPAVLEQLESYLVTNLGKTVVVARDTPNFIANRIGCFSILALMKYTTELNIPFEVVDQLTGKGLGRAKSATYRTLDVVGLDVLKHVIKTMETNCKDGFEDYYTLPTWFDKLVENGLLGQKTKAGIFKKEKDGIKVIDINAGNYRLADQKASKEILNTIKGKSWSERFDAWRNSDSSEAKFLWATFRDLFHYSAVLLGDITDCVRSVDVAIRKGFGWKEGIFEIWQQAGFQKIAKWIKEDIDAGQTVAKVPLPAWVFAQDAVYGENTHFSFSANKLIGLKLPKIYDRQLFPTCLLNEKSNIQKHVLYENGSVVLWNTGDDIGILSFKTKMCSIGVEVLDGLSHALDVAEEKCAGMVIWQEDSIFSVGANLEEFGFSFMMNGVEAVNDTIALGHANVVRRLRYSSIPVVAAVKGYAFGGGCEIMLHCDAIVAALESYIGLVEAGVGLIPGWGGSTEMAIRAANSINPWEDFTRRFQNLAMAKVATSAREAKEMGFLRESDDVVMNVDEILFVAKAKARYLAAKGYLPPIQPRVAVFGIQGMATIESLLANMHAGHQISDHDVSIARSLAYVMCGGNVDAGTVVSEDWLLHLEKEKFADLATSDKTAARIQHMLETGKPLRN